MRVGSFGGSRTEEALIRFDSKAARAVLVLSPGSPPGDQSALREAHGFLRDAAQELRVEVASYRGYLLLDLSIPAGRHPQTVLRRLGESVAAFLQETLGERPWVALVNVGGVVQIESAIREMRDAIRLASICWGFPGVLTRDDLLLIQAVSSDRTVLRRLTQVLDPLISRSPQRRVDLLETLEAYLAHEMSAVSAARSLGINRRTVEYRLKRAERLLQRSMHRLQDRTLIEAALIARRLTEGGSAPGSTAGGRVFDLRRSSSHDAG